MKEIISLTPLRSGREYLYPSPQLPSPTKSRTVCICNAHTDRLSFHYRAPSSRRIVRTASNSNPSTRNWGGGRGRGWSRWSQHVPRRVSKDSPSLLRFGDKPSFLSANSKHWSLSRPPSIVLPLPPLFASVWNVVPLPPRGWVRSGVYRFSTPNDRSCQVVLYWPAGFYTSPSRSNYPE